MLKNISKFESMIDGKTFQLLCESDSQINQAKEFAFQFLKFLGQVEDQIGVQQKQAVQEAESKIEELSV